MQSIELRVCKNISNELCGELELLKKNESLVKFKPTIQMITDEGAIIHHGFIFNAAAYAAMCAVNEPNAIIIYSEMKFLSPVELGVELKFNAKAVQSNSKKREVSVQGFLYNIKIFDATFHVAVFDKSIFKINFDTIDN